MKRYAFYVSGNAGRLKQFLESGYFLNCSSQISLVLSDNPKDTSLKNMLEGHSIHIHYFDLSEFNRSTQNINLSDFLHHLLQEYSVDYCFVFGGRILEGEILSSFKNRLINFHPSVLPAFKGQNSIDQAVKDKSFLLGNTAHFIVREVDSGPIIMQSIFHNSNSGSMMQLLNLQVPMLAQIIRWLNENRVFFSDGYALIKDASYETGLFIPRLDSDIHAEFILQN
ncbi:MAG: hypothetical protein EHM79_04955 [Geobacter sp.]|nr:MAG: hypothetical protein EHM79_04955 [Geobacter sp.]